MLLEQRAHAPKEVPLGDEPPGRVPVAAALHRYVEHRTVLVHRAPQPVLFAVDGDPSSRCHLSPWASAVERMRRAI
jgi:hypothetical protein